MHYNLLTRDLSSDHAIIAGYFSDLVGESCRGGEQSASEGVYGKSSFVIAISNHGGSHTFLVFWSIGQCQDYLLITLYRNGASIVPKTNGTSSKVTLPNVATQGRPLEE